MAEYTNPNNIAQQTSTIVKAWFPFPLLIRTDIKAEKAEYVKVLLKNLSVLSFVWMGTICEFSIKDSLSGLRNLSVHLHQLNNTSERQFMIYLSSHLRC